MKTNIGYFTTLIVWVALSFILHACGGGSEDAPEMSVSAPQCAASGVCK